MPNHVLNEIIIPLTNAAQRETILARVLGADGEIDFGILLPVPLNCWMGGVSSKHEAAFGITALDWCTKHWGTKWGAYRTRPIEHEESRLRFVFETAWRPPYGWLAALFNTFQTDIDHHWLDEGAAWSVTGLFRVKGAMPIDSPDWSERRADTETHERLHLLHHGCTSFDDDDDA